MGHLMDSCDVLDVLEEAVTLKRAVHVELKGGTEFEDRVRDVVTEEGVDLVTFRDHGQMPLRDVANARPAVPRG